MLKTTIDAVRAIVAADPQVTAEQRRVILDACRAKGDAARGATPHAALPELMTLGEAAAYMHVSRGWVRRLVAEGHLIGVRSLGKGRCRVVTVESVRAYVERGIERARGCVA